MEGNGGPAGPRWPRLLVCEPMDAAQLLAEASAFNERLDEVKRRLAPRSFGWYPYGSLSNFAHLDRLLTGEHRALLGLAKGRTILDIGAADGDTAFFLESLGQRVHVIDYPPTNFNGCQGFRALRDALDSDIPLTELDLDSQFQLPEGRFGLALVLGLLYHLKNPFYFLERLSERTEHIVLSTRVTRYNVADGSQVPAGPVNAARVDLKTVPVAYLVNPHETNNDPTNFWIFTVEGLRRLLKRTGWEILDLTTLGAIDASDPATAEGDERAFCLARSARATS
jgi:tRNA (mo5U34)-methyltransferase